MRILIAVLAAPLLCWSQGIITTVAGRGSSSGNAGCPDRGDGCQATDATLQSPTGLAFDAAGNLYISDNGDVRVRKVNTAGVIGTFAGGADPSTNNGDGGPATQAYLGSNWDVAADKAGNIYIATNGRVRKVDPSGIITTYAGNGTPNYGGDGGPATSASIRSPQCLLLDGAGNLYLADTNNFRVRKVTPDGIITTVVGSGRGSYSGDGGPATSAGISPAALAFDRAGNLYVADGLNNRIRKVDTAGIITTVAGGGLLSGSDIGDGGPALKATLSTPYGVAVDGAGNIYIGDYNNNRVRKVDASGIITTVAGGGANGNFPGGNGIGDGGPATSGVLGGPAGLLLDAAGNLYIADSGHGHVRKVTFPSVPSISANGVVNGASFQPGIVPGSWATILGAGLASKNDTWDNLIVDGKLPTKLDEVTVTVGGKPAYLYFSSPGQINFIVPDAGTGPVPVVVTTASGTSASFTVTASSFGPAFFLWPGNQIVATRQDFTLAARNGTFAGAITAAAKPGDTIILWGTGFGLTTPVAPVGFVTPSDTTYSTSTLPTVTIDNVPATVYGAALAPGFAGLYQVAIQVPASLSDGDWPVVAGIGGVSSPAGTLLSVKK
jgi:uncharacterized protein (TIGR03437 family)